MSKIKIAKQDLKAFTHLNDIKIPSPIKIFAKIIVAAIILFTLLLTITPWQQTSRGFGQVIAVDPNQRVQEINSPISGRVKKIYVQDGSKVKKNDIIAEIIDNDPQILERMRIQRDAAQRKLAVKETAAQTAKLNYDRQMGLFEKGLGSRKDFEQAKIEYKKLLAEQETAASEFAASETELSRQENQRIYAPRDGTILRILPNNNATIVKTGDVIATFAPELNDLLVELYVSSNDIPLIYKGRKVRLQFEGWPVVQFSGWPSLSIGTFGGMVTGVDPSISDNGKFRVIIKKAEGENWPDQRFLRHGTKTYGWVLLNEVRLGYEIWRQINSFPPEFDQQIVVKE